MDAHEPDHDEGRMERTTAPQQDYGSSEVTTGFVVLFVGLLVTFGLALALA